MWYNRQEILSHNKLISFILSNRGAGKTFTFKDWCIKDFIKNGNQFIWVRRYETELKSKMVNAFFDDIRELYPNVELTVKNNVPMINGKQAGYFVPLSTSMKLKSVPFPHVNKIIFDEFIIDKSSFRYIQNEPELLLDLLETVDRKRDKTRLILLGNRISLVNPYFLYYKISPKLDKRFTTWKDGTHREQIIIELFKDADFIKEKYDTRMGKLVKGTKYGDYAIENDSLRDNNTFIEAKTSTSMFMLYIKYNDNIYGFWVDFNKGLIYVNTQYDSYSYQGYCLQRDDHEPNILLIKSLANCKPIQRIVFAFQNGLIRFENVSVKNQFYEFIHFFLR